MFVNYTVPEHSRRRSIAITVLPLFLAALHGCATVTPKSNADPDTIVELMWPEPPLKTRIKFLGNLASEHDLRIGRTWKEDVVQFLAGGPPPFAQLANPVGIALSADAQRVYVTDLPQAKVFIFDLASKELRSWSREETKLSGPMGIALDADENVYIVDSYENAVRVFDRQGKPLRTFGHPSFHRVTQVAVDQKRGRLYVSDTAHQNVSDHRIKVFDLTGEFIKDLGNGKGDLEGHLLFPTYLSLDDKGQLYVSDTMNGRVQVFDPESGKVVAVYGERGTAFGQFERPKGVAVDSFGNVYVVDSAWANVQIFNAKGQVLLFFGGRGRYPGLMNNPTAIAIDKDNRIFVADTQNFRLNMYQLVNTTAEDSFTPADAQPPTVSSSPKAASPQAAGPAQVVTGMN